MEPVAKVGVTVTFLRMERRPSDAAPALPPGTGVVRLDACTVSFYRYLYNTVGADYLWWLRRTMPDRELAELLAGKTALDDELQRLRAEIATAKKANIQQPDTHDYSEAETRDADEIWVTSSTKEVLAITTLDGKPVGDGKPGPLFQRMHALYQEFKQTLMRHAA